MAYKGSKKFLVVDGEEGKQYDEIWADNLFFSPDSRRVAYVAVEGNKQFAVVDGKEEKQYDEIWSRSLIFSLDSRHIAYSAGRGNKWVVVVDRKEGKQYDSILGVSSGGGMIFDTPNNLHYLARNGADIYLVEEEIN